jgi:hypothetical protein
MKYVKLPSVASLAIIYSFPQIILTVSHASFTSLEDFTYSSELHRNWRMPSSGVWRRVDVVDWTDVSEDRIAPSSG